MGGRSEKKKKRASFATQKEKKSRDAIFVYKIYC